MIKQWLLLLATMSTNTALFATSFLFPVENTPRYCAITPTIPLHKIKHLLQQQTPALSTAVIYKVLTILKCADKYHVQRNHILTVIDYSRPAGEKRLWVFDLAEQKLLFHTYVSHGIKSGATLSSSFSNKYDSKSSSIGVYKTEKTYYGRDGLSLKLNGLESGFNDHAFNRSIVMHGGWYVDEPFIKKYGRSGRSWGCPALPLNVTEPIISTIKDHSLFIAYYPNDRWFLKSKFLTCDIASHDNSKDAEEMAITDDPVREPILLAHAAHKENELVAVMPADNYTQIFHDTAPLNRMLRRQISGAEYIALSNRELNQLIDHNELSQIYFVTPVIKMLRGYYATEMHLVNLGKIKHVSLNTQTPQEGYTVQFDGATALHLKPTTQFIRWVGL